MDPDTILYLELDMEIVDIHSHHLSGDPRRAILNIRFLKDDFVLEPGRFYSLGVHPWEVELENQIDWRLFEELAGNARVLAVGECGLDKQVHAEWMPAQERIFLRQLAIAERLKKPVVIHNVKSTGVIERLKRNSPDTIPYIQHGFRGKPQLALEMLRAGFYLSFGARYNEEALRVMPLDRLFLETDDSATDICEIYKKAADVMGIAVEKLTEQVRCNIKKVFFKG